MKKTKGFTLIELLITMIILGIILGIGMVKFDFLRNYKEKMEIHLVLDGLNYSRRNAINTGHDNKFIVDSNNSRIAIYSGEKEKYIDINRLKLNSSETSIIFKPTGAPDKGRTFNFKGKNKKYRITVEPATGKVNLYEEKN